MWIKICGIRDAALAGEIAQLGPSAIGLNFYRASPRAVSVETAAAIARALPPDVEAVGLFVNHGAHEIASIARTCGLSALQLHGDELPEFLAGLQQTLPDARLIRAHRLGPEGLAPLAGYLDRCRELGVELKACLIDARVEGMYGGSGKTVCWETLASGWRTDWPPLVLAGGLTPANVAEAIREVRPWGVDVASGIETSPGCPDYRLIEQFIRNARGAINDAAAMLPQGR